MEILLLSFIGAIVTTTVLVYSEERGYSSLEKDGMLFRMLGYLLAVELVSLFILSLFAS